MAPTVETNTFLVNGTANSIHEMATTSNNNSVATVAGVSPRSNINNSDGGTKSSVRFADLLNKSNKMDGKLSQLNAIGRSRSGTERSPRSALDIWRESKIKSASDVSRRKSDKNDDGDEDDDGDDDDFTVEHDTLKNLRENEKKYRVEFFKREPCLYDHSVYKNAATVFDTLKRDVVHEELVPQTIHGRAVQRAQVQTRLVRTATPDIPYIDFENEKQKRLTFQLAFSTLKYQQLMDWLLEEVLFFSVYPECSHNPALVMVMLNDFQHRKFQQRLKQPGEVIDRELQHIEDILVAIKTKFQASLARNRIKNHAASVDHLLPDTLRDKEEGSSKMPLSAWVNNLHTTMSTVCDQFIDEGYTKIEPTEVMDGHVFYEDRHCSDLLVFAPKCRDLIGQHELVEKGHLVLQDKSSCFAVESVKWLVGENDDIIHVNAGIGVTTAHLASVLVEGSHRIFAVSGMKSDEDYDRLQNKLTYLGAHNVRVLKDSFLDISPDDNRFKTARVVLISAECSKSGINNPIDFIVNEGEDMTLLRDLSTGEADHGKLTELISQQTALLKHALRLTRIQAVIYCTKSVYETENENVVTRSIEYTNNIRGKKLPFRVAPPVLPFTREDVSQGNLLNGKYLKVRRTETSSGSFMALIARQPEAKESAKDIIAKAQAKGLLGDDGKNEEEKVEENTVEPEVRKERTTEDIMRSLLESVNKSPAKVKMPGKNKKSGKKAVHKTKSSPPQANYSHISAKVTSQSFGSISPRSPRKSGPTSAVDINGSVSGTPIIPIGDRLYSQRPRLSQEDLKLKRPDPVAEYQRVIRHPAPFRF